MFKGVPPSPTELLVKLTIVSPTFNERENVGRLVEMIRSAVDEIDYEILIVDDDSPDQTWQVVSELAKSDPRVRLLRRPDSFPIGHRQGPAS